jgi:NTP pyrophosphatase (non-canonical NTP hydrolase)
MDKPPLINWNNLREVQAEITRWANEKFPHRTDHQAIYKLVVEEIPELMIHKKEEGNHRIGTELADCFILLLDLASMWRVDIGQAIQEKMEINYDRSWDMDVNGIHQHVPVQDDSQADSPAGPYKCSSCPGSPGSRALTRAEKAENQVQWGNQSTCPYDRMCLSCGSAFSSDCPF